MPGSYLNTPTRSNNSNRDLTKTPPLDDDEDYADYPSSSRMNTTASRGLYTSNSYDDDDYSEEDDESEEGWSDDSGKDSDSFKEFSRTQTPPIASSPSPPPPSARKATPGGGVTKPSAAAAAADSPPPEAAPTKKKATTVVRSDSGSGGADSDNNMDVYDDNDDYYRPPGGGAGGGGRGRGPPPPMAPGGPGAFYGGGGGGAPMNNVVPNDDDDESDEESYSRSALGVTPQYLAAAGTGGGARRSRSKSPSSPVPSRGPPPPQQQPVPAMMPVPPVQQPPYQQEQQRAPSPPAMAHSAAGRAPLSPQGKVEPAQYLGYRGLDSKRKTQPRYVPEPSGPDPNDDPDAYYDKYHHQQQEQVPPPHPDDQYYDQQGYDQGDPNGYDHGRYANDPQQAPPQYAQQGFEQPYDDRGMGRSGHKPTYVEEPMPDDEQRDFGPNPGGAEGTDADGNYAHQQSYMGGSDRGDRSTNERFDDEPYDGRRGESNIVEPDENPRDQGRGAPTAAVAFGADQDANVRNGGSAGSPAKEVYDAERPPPIPPHDYKDDHLGDLTEDDDPNKKGTRSTIADTYLSESEKRSRKTVMWLLICLGISLVCCAALAGGIVGAMVFSKRNAASAPAAVGATPAPGAATTPAPAPAPATTAAPGTEGGGDEEPPAAETTTPAEPGEETPATEAPATEAPAETEAPANGVVTNQALYDAIAAASPDGGAAILVDGTPQNLAYKSIQAEESDLPDDRQIQRYAMRTLYFSTNADNTWVVNTGWQPNEGQTSIDECLWYTQAADGMCDGNTVQTIEFVGNGLVGTVPPELSMLTSLKRFYIKGVEGEPGLTGALPAELGNLSTMEVFLVSEHAFTDPLPATLFDNWSSATVVNIVNSAVPGPIPPTTGLAACSNFNLGQNALTGAFPDVTSNAGLVLFSVQDNQLSGPMPAGNWANLANMRNFAAGGNQLDGPIPEDIGGMANLKALLDLSNNQFTSTIPASLNSLNQLASLFLQNNLLTGPVPDLSGMTSLKDVRIDNNQLTGEVDAATCTVWSGGTNSYADCAAGGEVTCTCCTVCCAEGTAECA